MNFNLRLFCSIIVLINLDQCLSKSKPAYIIDETEGDFNNDALYNTSTACLANTRSAKQDLSNRDFVKKACYYIRACQLHCHQSLHYRLVRYTVNNLDFKCMRLINRIEVSNSHKDRKLKIKQFTLIHDRNITVRQSRHKRESSLSFQLYGKTRFPRRTNVAKQLVSSLNVASGAICLVAGFVVLPTIASGGALLPAEAVFATACTLTAAAAGMIEGIIGYFDIIR